MNTLHRLALGFASALALTPAFAGAARAGDVTYPQLTTATTVVDTDVLATWRSAGPLTRINASTLAAYLQGKFNSDYLQISNNLSEFATSPSAVRGNLGLGTAATQYIGTSGANLCLLNANCTWSGTELFQAKVTTGAPTSAGAMFNLLPGSAPSSPINGDVWMTSSGEFERVNGATQQVAYLTSNVASASFATTAGSATTATTASNANALGGVAPSGYVQNNGGTYSINISGNASSANSASTAGSASTATTAGTASALAGLTSSIATNGVIQIPSAGGTLYIEWGIYDAGCSTCWNSTSGVIITLPVTPPHGLLSVTATPYNDAGIGSARYPTIQNIGSNTFDIIGEGASDRGFYWMAIAY